MHPFLLYSSFDWIFLLSSYIMYYYFTLITKSKKKRHLLSTFSTSLPPSLELVIFDDKHHAYWYNSSQNRNASSSSLLVYFHEKDHSILDHYKHLEKLPSLFSNARDGRHSYTIVYLEYESERFSSIVQGCVDMYRSILRYHSWKKIGWVGFDFGTLVQAALYQQCQFQQIRMPDWIFHCNGVHAISSYDFYRRPWSSIRLFPSSMQSQISLSNYYQSIKCPLWIFHSRYNNVISLQEAMIAHRIVTTSCLHVMEGTHDSYLLHKQTEIDIERIIHDPDHESIFFSA